MNLLIHSCFLENENFTYKIKEYGDVHLVTHIIDLHRPS